MGVGVQVSKGVNSHITGISLNEDLTKIEEAASMEDQNQEYQINLKTHLNWQSQQWPCFFIIQPLNICYYLLKYMVSPIACDIKF